MTSETVKALTFYLMEKSTSADGTTIKLMGMALGIHQVAHS
jgi:hypothetical protein